MHSELTVTALPDGGYVVSSSPARPKDIGIRDLPNQLAAFSELGEALSFIDQQMLRSKGDTKA